MSSNTLSDVPARRGINNPAASPWAGWLIIGLLALGSVHKPLGDSLEPIPQASGKPNTTVLRMKLVDANPKPHMVGLQKLPGKVNYFMGKDPKQWHTRVSTYAKVKYENVYPGGHHSPPAARRTLPWTYWQNR